MKNGLLLFLILFAFACKKDKKNDEKTQTNPDAVKTFSLLGISYDLSSGIITSPGESSTSPFLYKLNLFSSGFTLTQVNDTVESVSGSGEGITVLFYSNSKTDITGSYTFSSTGTETAGTFDYASYGINYNITTSEGTNKDLTQGLLNITNKGDKVFNITLTGKDSDNNDFSLEYEGRLSPFGYDDEYF